MKFLASVCYTIRFWTIITILSIVLGTVAVLAAIVDRRGNLSHHIASLWSRWLCALNGVRVDLSGKENILQDRAQIFVANHQSYFDIFALAGYLPVQIRWMAKSSLFRIPFLGWSMKAVGYIPVNRKDKKKAYLSFLATIETIKSGNSVVIFPEGTRSEEGNIGPFKKGSHLLAIRSGAPMVPVTLMGSGKILKKKSVIVRPGSIRIIVNPPIFPSQITPGADDILKTVRGTILKTYQENLSEEGTRNPHISR